MTTDEFISTYRKEDVRRLALQAAKFPDVDMPFALDQIAGWQAARRKLPSWAAVDGLIYPPHISMEQCSSEATARYKAPSASPKGERCILEPEEKTPSNGNECILEPDENDTRYCQECLYDSEWCESEFQSQNNQIHNRNFQYVDITVFEYLHRFGNISIQLKIAITTVFIPLRFSVICYPGPYTAAHRARLLTSSSILLVLKL